AGLNRLYFRLRLTQPCLTVFHICPCRHVTALQLAKALGGTAAFITQRLGSAQLGPLLAIFQPHQQLVSFHDLPMAEVNLGDDGTDSSRESSAFRGPQGA